MSVVWYDLVSVGADESDLSCDVFWLDVGEWVSVTGFCWMWVGVGECDIFWLDMDECDIFGQVWVGVICYVWTWTGVGECEFFFWLGVGGCR